MSAPARRLPFAALTGCKLLSGEFKDRTQVCSFPADWARTNLGDRRIFSNLRRPPSAASLWPSLVNDIEGRFRCAAETGESRFRYNLANTRLASLRTQA